MPGVIYSQNDKVLVFDSCTSYGQAFDDPTGALVPQVIEGELALAPRFGACATPDVSLENLKGKVALYLQEDPQLCNPSAQQQWQSYKTVMDAGAIGVLHVNSATHVYPGQLYGSYNNDQSIQEYGAGFLNSTRIPFITCGANRVGEPYYDNSTSLVSSQSDVSNFVTAILDGDGTTSFPTGLNVTLVSDVNEWDLMFQSDAYKIVFRGVMPLMFLSMFVLAMFYSSQRVLKIMSSNRHNREKCGDLINAPLIALQIEAWSTFALGLYFAIDGHWSVYGSILENARAVFSGLLIMATGASSVLVGLSFYDFKRNTKKMQRQEGAISRYRWLLVGATVLFITLEVVLAASREVPLFYTAVSVTSTGVAIVCSIWFVIQGYTFANYVARLGLNSTAKFRGAGSIWHVHRHTTRWITVASVALVVEVIVLMMAIIFPNVLKSPDRYFGYWFVASYFRALLSFSKVNLCRANKSKGSTAATRANIEWITQSNAGGTNEEKATRAGTTILSPGSSFHSIQSQIDEVV